ncbi:MAG TPA: hypothetical protein VHQ04_00840, partial [Puia sp.]|jgi:hypothetical protein|nr:hypothetical protein [Puia sp.]
MGTKLSLRDKEIYKKIDEILYYEWNPIGIEDLPRNEYQSYIPIIFNLKKAGASNEEIATTLFQIESDDIGMPGTIEFCRTIAKKVEDI